MAKLGGSSLKGKARSTKKSTRGDQKGLKKGLHPSRTVKGANLKRHHKKSDLKTNVATKNRLRSEQKRVSGTKNIRISKEKKRKAAEFAKRMKAGRRFQKTVNGDLGKKHKNVYSEVYIKGKNSHNARIDHLVENKQLRPYSTKNSRWHKVQPATYKNYVREVANYPGQTILTKKPGYEHLRGRKVGGKPVLVMPKKHLTKDTRPRLQEIETYARRKGVSISLQ